MTRLYQSMYRANPKHQAQEQLAGRTHYVDDSTLRFFHSRIVNCDIAQEGTLFWLIESCSLDHANTKRGFRYVVFDVFGTVISRVELKDAFRSSAKALKAMREYLASVNGKEITLTGLKSRKKQDERDYSYLKEQVKNVRVAQ